MQNAAYNKARQIFGGIIMRMPDNIEAILKSKQAQTLLQSENVAKALSESPEVQKLMSLLGTKGEANLQDIAQSAMQGDTTKLSA